MEASQRGLIPNLKNSIWPSEYSERNAETACRFIFENVETWDESGGLDRPIPDLEYLRELAQVWWDCYEAGRPLHIEKSRRMIVSWFCSALELHLAGLGRGRFLIGARKYDGANGSRNFVWRVHYLYRRLKLNRPWWELPNVQMSGSLVRQEIDSLVLPNGSRFDAVNSEGESFRGAGATVARVEELSQFAEVASLWGQAMTVVQGAPGERGGFAYSISNASANQEFRDLVQR